MTNDIFTAEVAFHKFVMLSNLPDFCGHAMKLHTRREIQMTQILRSLLTKLEQGPMKVYDAAQMLNVSLVSARTYLNKLIDADLVRRKYCYEYRKRVFIYEISENSQQF